MKGISMGKFIISGTWALEIKNVLKCTSKYFFSILFAPIAIAMRQQNDKWIKSIMLWQKPNKAMSH